MGNVSGFCKFLNFKEKCSCLWKNSKVLWLCDFTLVYLLHCYIKGSTWEEIQSGCYGAMVKWLGFGLSILGSWVQNHRVTPTLTHTSILPRSIRWVSGAHVDSVVKSNSFLCRSSLTLRQFNCIHEKRN